MKVIRNKDGFIKKVKLTKKDTYSFDITLATIIAAGLKQLRRDTNGYPCGLTEKEWNKILKKMQKGFELISDEKHLLYDQTHSKKVEEALDLFRKYYFHLWW